jgi:hypothetical protein
MAAIDHPRSRNACTSTASPHVSMESGLLRGCGLDTVSIEGVPLLLVDLQRPTRVLRGGEIQGASLGSPVILSTVTDTRDGQQTGSNRWL